MQRNVPCDSAASADTKCAWMHGTNAATTRSVESYSNRFGECTRCTATVTVIGTKLWQIEKICRQKSDRRKWDRRDGSDHERVFVCIDSICGSHMECIINTCGKCLAVVHVITIACLICKFHSCCISNSSIAVALAAATSIAYW